VLSSAEAVQLYQKNAPSREPIDAREVEYLSAEALIFNRATPCEMNEEIERLRGGKRD
jgi:hypothetical protein